MPGDRKKRPSNNLMNVSVRTFGKTIIEKGSSESKIQDPFSSIYGTTPGTSLQILAPPYNLVHLAQMVEISDTLGQCIEAMSFLVITDF